MTTTSAGVEALVMNGEGERARPEKTSGCGHLRPHPPTRESRAPTPLHHVDPRRTLGRKAPLVRLSPIHRSCVDRSAQCLSDELRLEPGDDLPRIARARIRSDQGDVAIAGRLENLHVGE